MFSRFLNGNPSMGGSVFTEKQLLYVVGFLGALTCSISILTESLFGILIPVVAALLVVSLYRMDLMFFFCALITPLSINLQKTPIGIGVSLPSEPLMFGLMLIFLATCLYHNKLGKEIIRHPVTIFILIHLAWMYFTSFTSTMPVVSLKATLARTCYVVVFFLLAILIFKNKEKIGTFIWCYLIPLIVAIAYTTFQHAMAGFTEKAAHSAMTPLYNDHTAYAAVIAMFIPMMFAFLDDHKKSFLFRSSCGAVLCILIGAVVLSYTRAAWVSLVAALLCYLVILMRVKTSLVIMAAISTVLIILFNWTDIKMELERTDEQSSTDYASHVQSVSNITTDASNVERINRWACALRMFAEKPILGWGPGTYVFQYAPFQKFSERTIISTNFGEGGNAHSEYIGAMAEQGVMGALFFILILIATVYRASRIIIHSKDRQIRLLAKGLLLGLVTYWVHATLNNFLDTEKASVPYWGFIAAIVALDLYHSKSEKEKSRASIS